VRVLVVEDVVSLANDIAEGLRDARMAVDVAYDGLEAAMKLDATCYDVVVLDRDLPLLRGDDICRKVVEGPGSTMVLMLTAATAAADRVGGLRLGADDYLTEVAPVRRTG
jgi:DNA-binding response OmpR family regulator